LPGLVVPGHAGWRRDFIDYAPHCVLLMFLASAFAVAESRWKQSPRTNLWLALLGPTIALMCYCSVVAIRVLAVASGA
jgi:hypothetical protein